MILSNVVNFMMHGTPPALQIWNRSWEFLPGDVARSKIAYCLEMDIVHRDASLLYFVSKAHSSRANGKFIDCLGVGTSG